MHLIEAMKIALQSLWANKLRSLLTLLGVVIGIASVIAVVTFINGINGYVATKIFNLGADVFIISKQANVITNVDQYLDAQKRKVLTLDDFNAVRDNCKSCKIVGASVRTDRTTVKYGMQSTTDTGCRGWTPSMGPIYDLDVVQGRSITESEMSNASAVVVIGNDIKDNLFPGTDPIGKEIRVDGWTYQVIGLGKKEGTTLGMSRDNWVMMPITTWFKQYGAAKNSIKIWGKGEDVGLPLQNAIDEARVIVRARRHDAPNMPDSFVAETNSSFLSLWSSISDNIFIVTVAIASISLIVGGIVIMNIMLVSVSERTREIGVRKALGARRSDVLWQFLFESTTMALVGGVLGIACGVGIAKGVTAAIGMPSRVETWSVLAGLAVAAVVGIISGVYPANQASKLDPIVALRSEL
jgi:putative ABC transport system permease protein